MNAVPFRIPHTPASLSYDHVPAFRVEIVAVDGRDRFLLTRQEEAPYRGAWGLPSGDVTKDEFVYEAAPRKLHETTGLHGTFIRQIGFYEMIPREQQAVQHVPVAVCLVAVRHEDTAASEAKEGIMWAELIHPDLPPHLKEMLVRAGFRELPVMPTVQEVDN